MNELCTRIVTQNSTARQHTARLFWYILIDGGMKIFGNQTVGTNPRIHPQIHSSSNAHIATKCVINTVLSILVPSSAARGGNVKLINAPDGAIYKSLLSTTTNEVGWMVSWTDDNVCSVPISFSPYCSYKCSTSMSFPAPRASNVGGAGQSNYDDSRLCFILASPPPTIQRRWVENLALANTKGQNVRRRRCVTI